MTASSVEDRNHFIEQGAKVTAEGVFAVKRGLPDPTGAMVGENYQMVPYLPMIEVALSTAKRIIRISDGQGNNIVLTPQEEIHLSALSTARLAVLTAQQGESN